MFNNLIIPMDDGLLIVSLSNFMVSLIYILISIPLIKRKIKMNNWYGFRFPKAYKSDENWYKINEFGGRQLLVWGIVLLVLSFLKLIMGEVSHGFLIFLSFLPVIVIIVPIVKTIKYSKTL